jgi:hypothetical protein
MANSRTPSRSNEYALPGFGFMKRLKEIDRFFEKYLEEKRQEDENQARIDAPPAEDL